MPGGGSISSHESRTPSSAVTDEGVPGGQRPRVVGAGGQLSGERVPVDGVAVAPAGGEADGGARGRGAGKPTRDTDGLPGSAVVHGQPRRSQPRSPRPVHPRPVHHRPVHHRAEHAPAVHTGDDLVVDRAQLVRPVLRGGLSAATRPEQHALARPPRPSSSPQSTTTWSMHTRPTTGRSRPPSSTRMRPPKFSRRGTPSAYPIGRSARVVSVSARPGVPVGDALPGRHPLDQRHARGQRHRRAQRSSPATGRSSGSSP